MFHKVIHSPCRQPDRPPLPVFPLRTSPPIRLSPNSKPNFFTANQTAGAHHCATFHHGRHECTATDWPASVPSGTLRFSCYLRIRPAPRQGFRVPRPPAGRHPGRSRHHPGGSRHARRRRPGPEKQDSPGQRRPASPPHRIRPHPAPRVPRCRRASNNCAWSVRRWPVLRSKAANWRTSLPTPSNRPWASCSRTGAR